MASSKRRKTREGARRHKHKRFEPLRRRLQEGPLRGSKLVIEPSGKVNITPLEEVEVLT